MPRSPFRRVEKKVEGETPKEACRQLAGRDGIAGTSTERKSQGRGGGGHTTKNVMLKCQRACFKNVLRTAG